MDGRYTTRLPRGFDSPFEDLQLKSHATSSSLLPWSRVYRMTQSTESLPTPYQPKIYGSYSHSDTNGHGDVSSERHFAGSHHYKVRFDIFILFHFFQRLQRLQTQFLCCNAQWRIQQALYIGFCIMEGTGVLLTLGTHPPYVDQFRTFVRLHKNSTHL